MQRSPVSRLPLLISCQRFLLLVFFQAPNDQVSLVQECKAAYIAKEASLRPPKYTRTFIPSFKIQYYSRSSTMPGPTNESEAGTLELDAVIVGAGFSGVYTLQRLRDELNMKVKILEAGSGLGGVWNSNTYPGARVDSPSPYYAFDFEEVGRTWNWTELYPGQKEIQAYFEYVDDLLSIRKDCIFNTRVTAAHFDPIKARWTVRTDNGQLTNVHAKYFIPAVGGFSKQYVPQWKGIESFHGPIYHSSAWPKGAVDVRGKRVAVVGTGCSGVQIIQEWAKEADETIVFQRTPTIALPMKKQLKLDLAKQEQFKKESAGGFSRFWATGSTRPAGRTALNFADHTPEEWLKILNAMYDEGGLDLWVNSYKDLFTDLEANRFMYDFWTSRTRERIQDPTKRDLLAPLDPVYPFGTKRVVMEQDYYEQFNKPKVHIVDASADPIAEITPRGILTESGRLFEVDAVALATGFDVGAGSLAQIDIRESATDVPIGERWKNGVVTFLGLMVPGFPNMFTPYGPQSPGELSDGPTLSLLHVNWIRDLIRKMEEEGIRSVEVRRQVAQAWREEVLNGGNSSLLAQAKTYYYGWNVPHKPKELIYHFCLHFPSYMQKCADPLGVDFAKSFVCA